MRTFIRYSVDKMRQANTYVVVLIVGSLINVYGQFIVPFLRGDEEPFLHFYEKLNQQPALIILSIALGYIFPLCVTVFTAAFTRRQMEVYESQAIFPALKPDPVFRSKKDGTILLAGGRTQAILSRYSITNAKDLLGGETWRRIVNNDENEIQVYVPSIGSHFIVVYAHTEDGLINVYMTRRQQ